MRALLSSSAGYGSAFRRWSPGRPRSVPDADEVRSVDRSHAHPRGTDGSQTRPWRELDPNSQFRARYGFGSETSFWPAFADGGSSLISKIREGQFPIPMHNPA